MTEKKTGQIKSASAQHREDRLKAALKANLARRKTQSRQRNKAAQAEDESKGQ